MKSDNILPVYKHALRIFNNMHSYSSIYQVHCKLDYKRLSHLILSDFGEISPFKMKRTEIIKLTMIEENRWFMGKNTSLTSGIVTESSMGTSDSKMPKIVSDNTELFKYWALGLIGSRASPCSNSMFSRFSNALKLI